MIKRYKAIEDTLKELKIKGEEDKDLLRIFGVLVLDNQRRLILKDIKTKFPVAELK